MEDIKFRFVQDRIMDLRREEEELKKYYCKNFEDISEEDKMMLINKIQCIRNEINNLNKALEYELIGRCQSR